MKKSFRGEGKINQAPNASKATGLAVRQHSVHQLQVAQAPSHQASSYVPGYLGAVPATSPHFRCRLLILISTSTSLQPHPPNQHRAAHLLTLHLHSHRPADHVFTVRLNVHACDNGAQSARRRGQPSG